MITNLKLVVALGVTVISGIYATPSSAHSYRTVERSHDAIKSVAVINQDDTIVISAVIVIHGNGAEQNPSTTVEIAVDGNPCETRTFNWKDGPARFDFSCTIALKKGTHGIIARELSNQRATADAISINMKRALNAESDPVPF